MLKNRSLPLVACVVAAFVFGACQEELNGGNACPSLCNEQQLKFRDTVFDAADVIDTAVTLPGIPSIGTELQLLVARYAQTGDSVVSVAVFRFDTLRRAIAPVDTTKPLEPFVSVDSTALDLYVLPPPAGLDSIYVQDTVTFLVYDVYVDAADLDTGKVHARFTGTPVGSVTLPRDSVTAAVRIPLDTAWVTQQIVAGNRIWLGVTVVSKKNAQVAFASQEGSVSSTTIPYLEYRGHDAADSTLSIKAAPQAKATLSPPSVAGPAIPALGDYQMIFQGAPAVPAGMLAVGGLPSNRTIIRFKFPAWLVDSSTTVVRANLELSQAQFSAYRADSDSLFMQPLVAISAPAVTDLSKMGVLLLDQSSATTLATAIKQMKLPAYSTSLDTIELVRTGANVFTFWRVRGDAIQRAIVLTLVGEGAEPRELLFYGPSASPALRPRVHVSYVPHSAIGIP